MSDGRATKGRKRRMSKRAAALVKKFGEACANYAWAGAGEPEEDTKLLPALKRAESALCGYINRLENELESLKRGDATCPQKTD